MVHDHSEYKHQADTCYKYTRMLPSCMWGDRPLDRLKAILLASPGEFLAKWTDNLSMYIKKNWYKSLEKYSKLPNFITELWSVITHVTSLGNTDSQVMMAWNAICLSCSGWNNQIK